MFGIALTVIMKTKAMFLFWVQLGIYKLYTHTIWWWFKQPELPQYYDGLNPPIDSVDFAAKRHATGEF